MKKSREMAGWIRYLAGALGLAALVAAALLLPQAVFEIQDRALCRETTLEDGEDVSLTLIDSTYETSLYERLTKFAAGLAEGRDYYVSQQEMEVTPEVRVQLETAFNDVAGEEFYIYWLLMEVGYLPVVYLDLENTLPDTMKQYVIYSDDYREGVNFILWCLELHQSINGQEYTLTLLIDAKTMSLYGFSTGQPQPATYWAWDVGDRYGNTLDPGADVRESGRTFYYLEDRGWAGKYASLQEYNQVYGMSSEEWWAFLGSYYQGMMGGPGADWLNDVEQRMVKEWDQMLLEWGMEDVNPYEWQDENTLLFSYVFAENLLHLKIHVWGVGNAGETGNAQKTGSAYGTDGELVYVDASRRYPGIRFELSELCRLIPAFSEGE